MNPKHWVKPYPNPYPQMSGFIWSPESVGRAIQPQPQGNLKNKTEIGTLEVPGALALSYTPANNILEDNMSFGFGDWMEGDCLLDDIDEWYDTEDILADELEDSDFIEDAEEDLAEIHPSRDDFIQEMENTLDSRDDFLSLEEATVMGGLFGMAANQEDVKISNKDNVDAEDVFDDLDHELKSDKTWRHLYYEDPEFARFVYKSVEEAIEQADLDVLEKRQNMKKSAPKQENS